MELNQYRVKIRKAKVGWIGSVSKETLIQVSGIDDWWMAWDPEPSYWRPFHRMAIRAAGRKRNQLEAKDSRLNSERVV